MMRNSSDFHFFPELEEKKRNARRDSFLIEYSNEIKAIVIFFVGERKEKKRYRTSDYISKDKHRYFYS